MEENDVISFIRKKDFELIEKIGHGACGETALIRDGIINVYFVAKKYETLDPRKQMAFFENFKNEIKLLFLVYHRNIVRIFNYYLYPDQYTGFIIMEYVKGKNIYEYLKDNTIKINDIFVQVIEAFKYLEENKILHRDIRENNILVTLDGVVKVIDFGFGKKINFKEDNNKSISLNWIADPPSEFENEIYDNRTEIYFIGKLFEKFITNNEVANFSYKEILKSMIEWDYDKRINSFNEILKKISKIQLDNPNKIDNLDELFLDEEIKLYREVSQSICYNIVSIEESAKFIENTDEILRKLNEVITNCMLEEWVTSERKVVECFVDGDFRMVDKEFRSGIKVSELRRFKNMLANAEYEKKKIILGNLQTKMDDIDKYTNIEYVDDLPF